jgi:DNA modification methylase
MGEILYNGDCLEVMKILDAESVDCVITSPP